MRGQRGLTLVEVLAATLVLGLVVVAASWSLGTSVTAQAVLAEDALDAALVAREIYELALRQDSADDGDPPATDAAGVAGLDSLDGATFSPPLNAGCAPLELAAADLWRQDVDLQVYTLADLQTPVSESFAGAAQDSSTLYRLTVTVFHRGLQQGSWWWWVNP